MRLFSKPFMQSRVVGYLAAVVVLSICILLLLPIRDFLQRTQVSPTEQEQWIEFPAVTLFILAVLLVTRVWGNKPAVLASVLSILALNYYFQPPYNSLFVEEPRHFLVLVSFAVMALSIGWLSHKLRQRAEEAEQAKAEAERLYITLEGTFEQASQAEAIRRSEAYIKLAQSIAKAGFFDCDIPSKTVHWSESYREVLGIDRFVQPKYENWLYAVHPEDRQRLQRTVQDFLASGKDQDQVDFRTIASDGNIRWINARRGLIRDASGAPVRLVGAVIDVTELKRNEEAARVGERFKSILLDCITHDLRTPLTSIRVATTSLLRGSSLNTVMGENQRELLGVIDEEATRLDDYVYNLVAMARIESDALNLQQTSVHMKDVVAESLDRIQPAAVRTRVQLRIPEDLPPAAADSRAIVHVIYNLLDNACRYAPDTAIAVSAHQRDGEILLSVEDQGPGIPVALRERVFEKFHRVQQASAHDERRSSGCGLGMGLAIARGLVQAQGGKIWIEDAESGHGTKVVFTLPQRNAELSVKTRHTAADAQRHQL